MAVLTSWTISPACEEIRLLDDKESTWLQGIPELAEHVIAALVVDQHIPAMGEIKRCVQRHLKKVTRDDANCGSVNAAQIPHITINTNDSTCLAHGGSHPFQQGASPGANLKTAPASRNASALHVRDRRRIKQLFNQSQSGQFPVLLMLVKNVVRNTPAPTIESSRVGETVFFRTRPSTYAVSPSDSTMSPKIVRIFVVSVAGSGEPTIVSTFSSRCCTFPVPISSEEIASWLIPNL